MKSVTEVVELLLEGFKIIREATSDLKDVDIPKATTSGINDIIEKLEEFRKGNPKNGGWTDLERMLR